MTQTGPAYATELEESFARFLALYDRLTPEEIEGAPLAGGWTPKTILAHVAFWDDYQTRRMKAARAGSSAASGFARPAEDNDTRMANDGDRTYASILEAAKDARSRMVDFAGALEPQSLAEAYPEGARTLSLAALLRHMIKHTLEHDAELRAYVERVAAEDETQ
jgi:uncharacterized damage-inducible protein DinB